MRRSRAVSITALIAAAALILGACGKVDQEGSSSPSDKSPAASDGNAAVSSPGGSSAPGSSDSAAPKGKSVCGVPHGKYAEPTKVGGRVRIAWNQTFFSYNNSTGHGNATANANPRYLMAANEFYYDKDLNLINNDSFVTCDLVSENPLTIKYTYNKDAKWSDGVPVTAADLLLQWAAIGGHYNSKGIVFLGDGSSVEESTDEQLEGEPKVVDASGAEQTGEAYGKAHYTADEAKAAGDEKLKGTLKDGFKNVPATSAAFDAASQSMKLVTKFPEIGDDGQSLTITYDKYFVDYPFQLAITVPAHVVAKRAFGESDPTKATQELVTLFKDSLADPGKGGEKLKKVTEVWNKDFDYSELPSDPELYVSNGPYLLTEFKKDSHMTFKANPNYNWGPKPNVETITYRFMNDPMGAVQALRNGEVDMISPQATADVLGAVQGMKSLGVEVITGDDGTYEHVDLKGDAQDGVFNPETYGGDKEKALKVRQAFLKVVPREDIVNKLIKPLNPKATVRGTYNVVPGAPDYDDTAKENGMADIKLDIEGAKKLLAEAGVDKPKVRMLFASNNPRRVNEYQLIQKTAEEAGFEMINKSDPSWSQMLPTSRDYDVALFGWQSTAVGASQIGPNFKTGGSNNYYGYSNPEVDKLVDGLNEAKDAATIKDLNIKLEQQLVKDAFGVTLFQFPAIVAWQSKKVQNVSHIPLSPTIFWNFWEWTAGS